MPFSYNKLWKLLIDKNMTKSELTKAIGISSSTMAKMGKNENVSLEVIDKICALLEQWLMKFLWLRGRAIQSAIRPFPINS